MSDLKINLKELAYPCTTRTRAKEAVSKLRERMNDEPIILDLTSIKSVSLSFLDELIFWMASSASMRKLTFLTDDKIIHRKLARVADIRKNPYIKYQLSNGQIHEISPKPIEPIQAKFVPIKTYVNK